MGIIGETSIHDVDPETGRDTDRVIAMTQPASADAVAIVLTADPDGDSGLVRSEWLWIRLGNGDVILGVFPQDEAYFATEQERRV